MLIGVGAAIVAALLLSTGSVVQAFAVRRVDMQHGLRISLLRTLVRRRWWVTGTLTGYLAFPFELVALRHAPLAVVQPLHVTGLVLLLVVGVRVLGERLRRIDLAGLGGIVGGVVLVAQGAPAGVGHAVSFAALVGVAGGLVMLACLPYLARERCGKLSVMLSAALAFTAVNLAVKGFSDQLATSHYGLAAAYLAMAAVGSVVAILSQMTAFQRHRAVEVVPLTFAIPTFLPVVLGLFVLQEDWSSAAAGGAVFAVGATLLLAGSAVISGSDAVIGASAAARGDGARN